MRRLRGLIALVVVLVPCRAAAQRAPAIDSLRLRLAREVVIATRADSLILRSLESTLPLQRAANPNVPAVFWDEFLARARRDLPLLVDSLVPVYAARFSPEELRGLRAFYETPLGRRLVAEQPELQQGGLRVGSRWGAVVGAQIAADLAKRGITVQN